jgi:aryl-alcohol dehydrogenase-like predicted oxidoreductase
MNPFERTKSEEVIKCALDLGINFFDTANSYQAGLNEKLLGRILHPHWEKIIISTKLGYASSLAGKAMNRILNMCGKDNHARPDSAFIIRELERSLRHLKVDHIDLLQIHNPIVTKEMFDEMADLMESLIRQGKVRYYGVSFLDLGDFLLSLPFKYFCAQIPLNSGNSSEYLKQEYGVKRKEIGIIARQPFVTLRKEATQCGNVAPDIYRRALKEVLVMDSVDSVIMGTSNTNHLKANVQSVEA